MFARLLRLIAVLLAGLLLGVGAFVTLVALGVVRNPLDPVIGGDIALARSSRRSPPSPAKSDSRAAPLV